MRRLMRAGVCAIAAFASVHTVAADEPVPHPIELRPAAEYRAELEAMLAEGQPGEGENAWDHLLAACAAWNQVNIWSNTVFSLTPNMPLSQQPRTSVDEMRFGELDLAVRKPGLEFLRRLGDAGVMDALDRADVAPRSVATFAWEGEVNGRSVTPAQQAKGPALFLTTSLISQMRVHSSRYDEDRIVETARRFVAMVRTLATDIDLLSVVMAQGCALGLCREICHETQESGYMDALIIRLEEQVARLDPYPSPARALSALPILERFIAAQHPDAYRSATQSGAEILAGVDVVTHEALAVLRTPASGRDRPGQAHLREHGIVPQAGETDDAFDSALTRLSGVIANQRLVESILSGDDWVRTMIRGTRIVLALERFRNSNGDYPISLDALVPAYLAAIPADPMTGKPMLYTRIENDPHGRDYLVYSTGIDGIDNGGRVPEGDHYANPASIETGFDFIVNQPRRVLDP